MSAWGCERNVFAMGHTIGQPTTSYFDDPPESVPASDLNDCNAQCARAPTCKALTYVAHGRKCFLFDRVTGTRPIVSTRGYETCTFA